MVRQNTLRLFSFFFFFISCSDFSDDINLDPNSLTSSPDYLLLRQSQLGVVYISSSQISRYVGMWTGQFANSRGCCRITSVEPEWVNPISFNRYWEDIYVQGSKNSYLALERASQQNHTVEEGIAKIMHGIYMGEAAALWGDIPCREAFNIMKHPNPHYDAQKNVFNDVQGLLSQGLEKLKNAPVAEVHGPPIFIPNEASWEEVAHSLKARYFLICKDYENALIESRKGISSPQADLLSFHRDEEGAKNLFFQFFEEERGYVIVPQPTHLVDLMTGKVPRELTTPGDSLRFDFYFKDAYYGPYFNTEPGGFFAADASYPIISWIETKLIEAEALERTGSGNGAIPFNEVRDWLNDLYGGGFPQTSSTGDQLLREILEEKYISLIGCVQIFNDIRRTNNILQIPFLGDQNAQHPQRFLYPQIEIDNNTNFPGLIDIYEPTPVNQ